MVKQKYISLKVHLKFMLLQLKKSVTKFVSNPKSDFFKKAVDSDHSSILNYCYNNGVSSQRG